MRTTFAVATSCSIALFAASAALAGDGPTGVGIRVVEIQAQDISLSSVFGKAEVTRTFNVDLGPGASSRMVMGLEVTGGGDEIILDITSGSVLLRNITAGTNASYTSTSADSIFLNDGSYMIAAGPAADLSLSWSEEGNFSEGDMTIESLVGRKASVTFHPSGDAGALWLGTNGEADSDLSVNFRVFDENAERSMVWVNDVTGDGTFTMPAEASDQVQTLFTPGDHGLELGQYSLLSIVLDRDEDDDDGGGSDTGPTGDLNGDCVVDGADLGLLLAQWGFNCP